MRIVPRRTPSATARIAAAAASSFARILPSALARAFGEFAIASGVREYARFAHRRREQTAI